MSHMYTHIQTQTTPFIKHMKEDLKAKDPSGAPSFACALRARLAGWGRMNIQFVCACMFIHHRN